jgi:hypothetical protein
MSAHATNHHSSRAARKTLTALAASSAGVWLAFMVTAGPAIAVEKPESHGQSQNAPNPAPSYEPGPPNYPNYDPQFEVSAPAEHKSGLDTTSVALGALGGIALGGAALGITLSVERRRGQFVPRSTEADAPTVGA